MPCAQNWAWKWWRQKYRWTRLWSIARRRFPPKTDRPSSLVRHRVDEVIETDADAHVGVFLRVSRLIGVFPRVAQVVIVSHHRDQPVMIVVDAAPVGVVAADTPGGISAALLAHAVGLRELHARHLIALIQVVDRMENRVVVGDVDDLSIGDHLL